MDRRPTHWWTAAMSADTGQDDRGIGFAKELFAADRASAAMGMQVLRCNDGHATVAMTVTDQMTNGHAIAHGGYIFALADTAFAMACNASGRPTVSAAASINYLAPAMAGDKLIAEAAVRVRQGTSGIFDVTVKRGIEVIAEFRGNCRERRR